MTHADFCASLERNLTVLCRMARWYRGVDTDDLVHDTVLAVLEKYVYLEAPRMPDREFRTWFMRWLLYTLLPQRRQAARKFEQPFEAFRQHDDDAPQLGATDPEAAMEQAVDARAIVESLDVEMQLLVYDAWVTRVPHAQLAEECGISVAGVRQRLARAKQLIRKNFAGNSPKRGRT